MKTWKIAFFLLAAFSLTGCFNVNDEVWIEPDGSGRFESVIDMSDMYGIMMMGLAEEMQDSTEAGEEDSFGKIFEGLLMAEEADTVISFGAMIEAEAAKDGGSLEMLLDSLRNMNPAEEGMTKEEQQEAVAMLESVSDLNLRIQTSQAEQMFKFTIIQAFSDPNSLVPMGKMMSEIGPFLDNSEGDSPAKNENMGMMEQMLGGATQLSLDGNTLRVQRSGMDLGELDEETQQQMQMMQMFTGGDEPYRMTIHFPGKVKKVSSDVAKQVDKNTVVIEVPQQDLFDPEKSIDVEIRFKGLKRK